MAQIYFKIAGSETSEKKQLMEKSLLNKTLVELSKFDCRLFRNNTGMGWVGKIIGRKTVEKITLAFPRPLRAGLCKGSPDLVGWTTIEILPEMVGKKVAIFTAIEAKTESTITSKEQKNFIKQVKKNGGIAGVFYNPTESKDIITEWKNQLKS